MTLVRLLLAMTALILCAPGCTDTAPVSTSERAPMMASVENAAAPSRAVRSPQRVAQDDAEEVEGEISDDSEPTLFRALDEAFGRKGEVKDGVYRLVTPRTDLMVTVEERDVPTGAFIESDFRFWRCPCGKLLMNGQFVVADYEVNDVVDELKLGKFEVAAIAPLLLFEHPRLMMIRFQGEGRPKPLASALISALSYTGEARHAPMPVDLSPVANKNFPA